LTILSRTSPVRYVTSPRCSEICYFGQVLDAVRYVYMIKLSSLRYVTRVYKCIHIYVFTSIDIGGSIYKKCIHIYVFTYIDIGGSI